MTDNLKHAPRVYPKIPLTVQEVVDYYKILARYVTVKRAVPQCACVNLIGREVYKCSRKRK